MGTQAGVGADALVREARGMAPDDPRRCAASIAMFDQVAVHWQLSAAERQTLLGGVTKSTWSDWKQHPLSARVRPDTRERIANLFTIDLIAHSVFAPEFADAWVRHPNDAFSGESAAAVMLRGKVEDLVSVRRYVERIAGGSSAYTENVTPLEAPRAPGAQPAPSDALTLIRADHEVLEALLAEALAEDASGAQRLSTIAQIARAFTAHAEMLETFFYPALREAGGSEERETAIEAEEELAVIKALLEKIQSSRGGDKTLSQLTVLNEIILHHLKTEERGTFAEARGVLGKDRLVSLGAEMARFKEHTMRVAASNAVRTGSAEPFYEQWGTRVARP